MGGCLWVFSYIKPQLRGYLWWCRQGVYGSFPTSNHNLRLSASVPLLGVYGSFPTSNHNTKAGAFACFAVFMGLFLHQTTTVRRLCAVAEWCLWVFSYIKPQLCPSCLVSKAGVYGSFPTSNHNRRRLKRFEEKVFMGLFLHQTTT